jgi:hypothetical protein
MDAKKTVPVKMTSTQAAILLEALKTSTNISYPIDKWEQLQDIKKQIETVPKRVAIFYDL